MTMVERVARALAAKRYMHVGGPDSLSLNSQVPCWKFCIDDARIAIEAMREPTKAMVEPGYDAIHNSIDFYNYDSDAGYTVEAFASADVWRAMIDAALSETQPSEGGK